MSVFVVVVVVDTVEGVESQALLCLGHSMEGYVIFTLIQRKKSHSMLVYGTLRGFKMYLFPSQQSCEQIQAIFLRDHEVARDPGKPTRFFIRDTIHHTIYQFDAVSPEDRNRWMVELNKMLAAIEECFQDHHLIAHAARTWSLSQKPEKPKKCVIVGDSSIGKTSALMALVTGEVRKCEDLPSTLPVCEHQLDGKNLVLYDTSGHSDYDPYRPSLYEDCKLFVICFSMDSRESLNNVRDRWRPEIRKHSDAPFVLVGLKADLARDSVPSSEEEEELDDPTSTISSHSGTTPSALSHEELQEFAEHLGILTYSVCSAKQPDSCKAAFRIVYAVASMTKKLIAGYIPSEAESDFDFSDMGSEAGSRSTPTHVRTISRDGEDDTFKAGMTPTPVHMSNPSREGDMDEFGGGTEQDFHPLPSGRRGSGDFSVFTNPLSIHAPTPIVGRRRGSSAFSNNSTSSFVVSSTGGSPQGPQLGMADRNSGTYQQQQRMQVAKSCVGGVLVSQRPCIVQEIIPAPGSAFSHDLLHASSPLQKECS